MLQMITLVRTPVCCLLLVIAARHVSSMNETTCELFMMSQDSVLEHASSLPQLETNIENVTTSAGMTLMFFSTFPSGSGYTYDTFSLVTYPPATLTPFCIVLANGDQQQHLNFVAQVKHDGIMISTFATLGNLSTILIAKLRVQGLLGRVGDLVSTIAPSNCQNVTQLHFTWTAPPTLQDIPILGYVINITHSDGLLLMNDTTLLPEYLYQRNTSSQQTIVFTVAARNIVGVGNESNITVTLPASAIPTTCTNVISSAEPTESSSTLTHMSPTPSSSGLSTDTILAITLPLLILIGLGVTGLVIVTVMILKPRKKKFTPESETDQNTTKERDAIKAEIELSQCKNSTGPKTPVHFTNIAS